MPQVSRTQRLTVVLALNLGLVAALVIVGITAHSLAVLAEGGDYLLDAAGVAVALLAIRLSARPARRARPSPTDIAALVNGGWLLVLELLVIAAAAERLLTRTPQVHGLPVLIVSGVAALTMTAGASSSEPIQTTMTPGGATCPSPPSSSIPSPTPPRRRHRRHRRDHPGHRRLVLARPRGGAHRRRGHRLPRPGAAPQSPHPAPVTGRARRRMLPVIICLRSRL